MPRSARYDTDDDDSWDDDPDESYLDDEDREEEDDDELPCPHCGAAIYEDAPRCPACGTYLTDAERLGDRRPWWVAVGVVLCLVLVYFWIFG